MDDRVDPCDALATAACDLVAESFGAAGCAVVAAADGSVLAATAGVAGRLDSRLSERIAFALAAAVDTDGAATEKVDRGATLLALQPALQPAEEAQAGGPLLVFARPQDRRALVVFAAPATAGERARAGAAALALLARLEAVAAEREELLKARQLLSHVEEFAKVGGWEQVLATGRFSWSGGVYAMHGLEPGSEVTLERILPLYPPPARDALRLDLERAAAEGGGFDLTAPVDTPGGERRIVRTVARSGQGPGGPTLYGITQDVTAQLSAERRMWWATNHDPVTRLPNRMLFEDRLELAVQRCRRMDETLALILVEIADFARLGGRTGFTAPDAHMSEIAARLVGVTRESDTVARIAGDQFAVLLNDVGDGQRLASLLRRLHEELTGMLNAGQHRDVVVSIGVACFPEHASEPDDLSRAAEMALARARRRLDQPVAVFDRQIAQDVQKRRDTVLRSARESLERGEFVPFYQLQVDIETNEIVGVEALARWQRPDVLLDAKDFTHALEDREIGGLVGRVMLDSVIADMRQLRRVVERPFRVSINASRNEVLRNDFLDTFLDKTREGDLTPSDFIIEITEDVIIGIDDQTLHDKISFLVSSGVVFSLDDFGTGYASLIHITSFPIKQIKIDKQFIFGIETDNRKRAIVKGINRIARSLDLDVIAEGVETVQQREALRSIGCRHVQGYLYSFPVPFAQLLDMLERH